MKPHIYVPMLKLVIRKSKWCPEICLDLVTYYGCRGYTPKSYLHKNWQI